MSSSDLGAGPAAGTPPRVRPLLVGGTWTVRITSRPGVEDAGNASWTYSLKAPKGAVYSAD